MCDVHQFQDNEKEPIQQDFLLKQFKIFCTFNAEGRHIDFPPSMLMIDSGSYFGGFWGVYLQICIHTCINAYMHTCIHAYIHVFTRTCAHAGIFIHTYIHTYIYTHTCMIAYMYACLYTYAYMIEYMYVHVCDYPHVSMIAHMDYAYILRLLCSRNLYSTLELIEWLTYKK